MKAVVTLLAIITLMIGFSIVMLGAMYKIQSWEMPVVAGVSLNLILLGLPIVGVGGALLIARLLFPKPVAEDRLELDGTRRAERPAQPLPRTDNDQYV